MSERSRRLPCVVLPVRGIADGKSRLAPVLAAPEREALNTWLLGRTLDVLDAWRGGLGACVVVSACERVLHIARTRGARVVEEKTVAGLNAAAGLGFLEAVKRRAPSILILPCDLPGLTPAALDRLAAETCGADVVIAPDKTAAGTNALIVTADRAMRFHFGSGSFERHCAEAAARGSSVAVHRDPAFTFDLDTPEDYAHWCETRHGKARETPMV